jgi:selenoprotein W-related protein
MDELLKEHEAMSESITLVPSDGGKYEVSVNGELIFSKKQLGRHAEGGEVSKLVRELL